MQANFGTGEFNCYSPLDAEKERLRQTERLLDEMAAAALAADQRAVQFCSALGVMLTIAAQLEPKGNIAKILQIDSLLALFIALALAAYSFRPKLAFSSGSPAIELDDYCAADNCCMLLSALAKKNDAAITRGRIALRENGVHFTIALKTAAIGTALLGLQILLPHFL